MKKLQNNFTTTEQSKRLLELGVPADSADCYYDSWGQIQWRQLNDLYHDFFQKYNYYTPCWSVGRLIEIYLLCAELKKPQMIFIKEDVLMMDRMINELCYMAESERLDFSKLEL